MNDQHLYCGLGTHIPYEDFMHLINLTFGFSTPEEQFLGLLPKLYREERRPQDHNYVVTEDGILAAAVGAFDHTVAVMGRTLPCRGIGNVAVHPDHRSRGYMKMTMEAALDDMVRDGIVLSALGGRRQRYQYFSYDKCGPCHTFVVTADNLRHTYGTLDAPAVARRVTDGSDAVLSAVKVLSDAAPVAPNRALSDFFDIACTWHAELWVVTDAQDDTLLGYAIVEPNGFVTEVRTADPADFMALIRTLFATLERGSITVRLGVFEPAYIAALSPIAEGCQTGCSMSYSVLDYARVIDAFWALEASYRRLADGSLTLWIHGHTRDERLTLTVRDGTTVVSEVDEHTPVDLELSHLDAMNLIFAPLSPERDASENPLLRDWFPLPLWIYRADEV